MIPLRHPQHIRDRAPGDRFLNVPAALLVLIQENVRLIHAPEKVMQISHDVLIRAHQKEAEIVRLARLQFMQWQRVLHVLQVDEFAHFPIGVAGDVHERSIAFRISIEPMHRHHREKLTERPVIEQRLEHGEVAHVLIAERDLEFLHLVRDVIHPFAKLHDQMRDLPVDRLDLRLALQLQQPEVEHRLRLLLDLLRVMERLHAVLPRHVFLQLQHVRQQLRIALGRVDRDGCLVFLDRAKSLHNQHRMMRHDRAPAFTHDRRMRHLLRVADFHDVIHNVARVFVQRVVRRAIESRARPVVVHAQSAADIEIL